MSNQPRRQSAALAFDRDEWELIVTLPRRVLMAALASTSADGGPAAVDGIAGIEAIAAGIASTSPLVREVVAAIYAEDHHEPVDLIGDPGVVQTLAACRYAAEVLAARCDPADATAYRQWLTDIAAVVNSVAHGRTGAVHAAPCRVGLAENRFLYALGGVLRP
jgi:hypothetical protein